jgi:hypothetical protein
MSKLKPKAKANSKPTKSRAAVVTKAAAAVPTNPVPQSAFSVGDRIHHVKFGGGKVVSIRDDKLTISFRGTTKEIREDFVVAKR